MEVELADRARPRPPSTRSAPSATTCSAGPASAGAGSAPSKYRPTIAATRDARLPNPLASSAVYRAVMSSHENEPSEPNWIARRK